MIRFLWHVLVQVVLAAAALLIAGWLIDGVELHVGGFFVAVGVFALAQSLLGPFVFNMARQYASAVLGGIGIVTTFLALWIATLFPGGLQISGVSAWIATPVIVWVITALGTWILMGLIIEKKLAAKAEMKRVARALEKK
ncbi:MULTISPECIES: phage holin family protein [unclassified Leucobacter]|uniref:phage holin family protein n=1 Tax=unclassified Leucobacter TaxID=2621730 RepID=UPI00165D9A1D|nr:MULTISPECIES: phage holin family protein [unclassified Leucobacter]MBC9926467.1 phage holin family protein [Leucobacter sp. cx-169]